MPFDRFLDLYEDCLTRGILPPGLDPRYPRLVTQDAQGNFRPRSVTTRFSRVYHQFFGDHFWSPIQYKWWHSWLTVPRLFDW